MKRYTNPILLCLFMLVVLNSPIKSSVEDPSHVGESFIAALKSRDYQQLANCFHSDVRAGFLTPNRSGEISGSNVVTGAFRLMLGNAEIFKIEESNVKRLSDNKVLISYRFRLDADTYYEQRIFAIVKGGLIESYNLLCSGSFNPK